MTLLSSPQWCSKNLSSNLRIVVVSYSMLIEICLSWKYLLQYKFLLLINIMKSQVGNKWPYLCFTENVMLFLEVEKNKLRVLLVRRPDTYETRKSKFGCDMKSTYLRAVHNAKKLGSWSLHRVICANSNFKAEITRNLFTSCFSRHIFCTFIVLTYLL